MCDWARLLGTGQAEVDWDDPAAKDALVSALVSDATRWWKRCGRRIPVSRRPGGGAAGAGRGQDVELAEGSDGTDGRRRIAARSPKIASCRPWILMRGSTRKSLRPAGTGTGRTWPPTRRPGPSPMEATKAEARRVPTLRSRKSSGRRRPAGPRPGLLRQAAALAGLRRDPLAWYGDSAYGTGDLRGAISDAAPGGDQPKPLRPIEGGFIVDDFTVDEQAGRVTCPAGHTAGLSRTGSPPSASGAGTARYAPGAPPAPPAEAGPARTRRPAARARADWAAVPGCARIHGLPAERGEGRRPGGHLPGRRRAPRPRADKNHAWLKRGTAALNLRT